MKLKDIAARLKVNLEPQDADVDITGLAGVEEARSGEITFIANRKYAAAAKTTQASAIIVDEKFPATGKPLLRTRNPQFAYARAMELFFQPPTYKPGIHPSAVIDASAKIGANASIGPAVVIDADVQIGNNCTLLAHTVIYRGV